MNFLTKIAWDKIFQAERDKALGYLPDGYEILDDSEVIQSDDLIWTSSGGFKPASDVYSVKGEKVKGKYAVIRKEVNSGK